MSPQPSHIYEFGPYRLDTAERLLLHGGDSVPLTPKAFDLLLVLVKHRGHLLQKEELLEAVWQDSFVEEANLSYNISALRKALGESPEGRRYIETVPKRGYRFAAEVREVAGGEDNPDSQSLAGAAVVQVDGEAIEVATATHEQIANTETKTKAVNQNRAGMFRLPLLAFAALVIAALVYAIYVREKAAPPPPTITSIVVLPLENLSGDPAQEYFADGMTDELTGTLAKIGALRVISRTSAMHYKGARKPLPEIARELGVDAVVEGSVARSGDRIRIRAQLVRAATDDHLWAETYDRDLRDILSLQSEVARSIAQEIRIRVTPSEQVRLASARPINTKALDHYLQGLYHSNRRTEEPLKRAVKYFESAIEEDPAYAPAYVGLAECYVALGTVNIGSLPPTEARRLARAAAMKALEIDGELADAHAAFGKVLHYEWDWSAAEQEFKRAIEINPSHAFTHNSYAYLLSSLGRVEEALAEIERAENLDPLSSPSVYRAYVLYMARRFDESREHYRRVIAAYPDNYFAHWNLGLVYAAESKYQEAIASFEKAAALSGRSPASLGGLGMVYALSGRRAEAHKLLADLIELSKHRYVTPAAIAQIHIGLGNKDQAFEWLEKAYQERSYFMAYIKVMANVDPLRPDPRFADLVRRVN